VAHPTVLIAPAIAIPALRQQTDLQDARSFADTDTERALDEIRRRPPALVALDRTFALSLLGQAFLGRLKSDDRLVPCAIQMVGIRQAPRHHVNAPIFIDGTPGMLIDVSATGARVRRASPLLPAHRLHLSLRMAAPPLSAFVVRLAPELSQDNPGYCAGVEFGASAAAAVADYVSDLPRRLNQS
jgi:hypothetical protein